MWASGALQPTVVCSARVVTVGGEVTSKGEEEMGERRKEREERRKKVKKESEERKGMKEKKRRKEKEKEKKREKEYSDRYTQHTPFCFCSSTARTRSQKHNAHHHTLRGTPHAT